VLTDVLVGIEAAVSFGLIVLILLHSGKGGGLSDMFGVSVGSTAAGSTVAEKNLDRDHDHLCRHLRLHYGDPRTALALTRAATRARFPGSLRGGHQRCRRAAAGRREPGPPAPGRARSERPGSVTVAVPDIPAELNPRRRRGRTRSPRCSSNRSCRSPSSSIRSTAPSRTGPPRLGGAGRRRAADPSCTRFNPDAHLSDGVAITAADFVYNWHEHLATGGVAPYRVAARLRGHRVGDRLERRRTVTVVFAESFADWEALFSRPRPAHVAAGRGWAGSRRRTRPPSSRADRS